MVSRILILGEDRRVLESLCDVLSGADRRLEVHGSAEAAWASIDRSPPDIVVLSASTRGLLGRPFVEDLRQHFSGRVSLVVADSRPDTANDPPAGTVAGREARLVRSLEHGTLVQRAVSRLLHGIDESECVEADEWEVGSQPNVPLWETPAVGLLDQLVDGIVITDEEGVVEFLNPAAATMLGVAPADALHQPFLDVDLEPGVRQLIEGAFGGLSDTGGSVCVPRSQAEGVVEVRVSRLEADGLRGRSWFIGLHDISEQVRIEHLRGHYLTVVAHELRTPLTVLNNLICVLTKDAPTQDKDELGAAARNQVRRLEHQIDKLLLLAGQGREGVAKEALCFDARDVVRDAVDSCIQQAEEAGTIFRLLLPDEPVDVCCDADDLRRAVYELTENAVKFTPRDGVVCVALRGGENEVELRVQDTGIGIESRYHEAVFDEFRQLERPITRHFGGAGLGLSLAKGLVESWGGRIEVESEPALGSTFTMSIPAAEPVECSENGPRTLEFSGVADEKLDG